MAYTTGTATDYIDLADKLRTFLTANGWTSLQWTPGTVGGGGMSLNLQGPGAGVGKRVYINIRSQHDDSNLIYCWQLSGAVSYNSGVTWGNQQSESTPTYFNLWKSTITYWIFANDRRFVVVAKCNTNYMSMYAGFFLPWATPEQYPFPLYIGGSSGNMQSYNSTYSNNRMFCDPAGSSSESVSDWGSGKVRNPNGTWERVLNEYDGTSNNDVVGNRETLPFMFPYANRGSSYGSIWIWSSRGTNDLCAKNRLVPTAQGERGMLPVYIQTALSPGGYGALDGVYFPMGQGLTPEQIGTMGLRNFQMFSNVHRISGDDFFAIEQV